MVHFYREELLKISEGVSTKEILPLSVARTFKKQGILLDTRSVVPHTGRQSTLTAKGRLILGLPERMGTK